MSGYSEFLRVEEICNSFTLPENMKLEVVSPHDWEYTHAIMIRSVMLAKNSRGDGQTEVTSQIHVWDGEPEEYTVGRIHNMLVQKVVHELHEWLSYKGEFRWDPHAEQT